jgi:AcrR family transcriptional regulator
VRRNALANRERILVAAEAVFGEYGATGSTEDVARRAKVGIATVFRHFPTKAALIEAALVRHFDLLNEQAAQLSGRANPGSALNELIRTMIEAGSTKLTLASLLSDGTFPPSVATVSNDLRSRVRDLLEHAQQSGQVREDVSVDEVYLLIRGLAQASATMPTSIETLQRAATVVIAGLRP